MSTAYSEGDVGVINKYRDNIAPENTKVFLLKLGYLEADSVFFLDGENVQKKSNLAAQTPSIHNRTKLQMYSVLIDHPVNGLILYEVGPGMQGWEEKWGTEVLDVFCRVDKDEDTQLLDKAIENVGYNINDVKHVIAGHLHIDHAGGLEYFVGKDTQIWVHEVELKHAFWGVATKADFGSYLPYYLNLDLNWNTFNDRTIDLFKGITLHWAPGHTPGLVMLQINLLHDGPFIFTSDHVIIKENYENGGRKQGLLMRDHVDWYNSTQLLRRLQRLSNAKVVFGHDVLTVESILQLKPYLE